MRVSYPAIWSTLITALAGLTLTGALTLTGMTSGSVLFAGTGGLVSQDNTNLSFNDGTNTLSVANASVTGNTTIGDASGDTVTANAGAWSFPNATTVGVTSTINFDSNTFLIDGANNRVGINTATTLANVDLTIGTQSSVSTETPKTISLGGTFSNAAGANSKLRVYDDGTNIYGIGASASSFDFTATGRFSWYNVTTERMRLDSNGNLGLATTAPLTKLDVAGNVRTTGKATAVLTGSIDPAASATVTGVGTLFTTELVVGDRITVTGETRTVTAIASATSLTVDSAFTDNANDTAPDVLYALETTRISSGTTTNVVNDLGYVGIGTTNPQKTLQVNGDISLSSAGQKYCFSSAATNCNNSLYRVSADGSTALTSPVDLVFGSGSLAATFVTIKSGTGNVGIGDTSPNSLLTVGSGDAFEVSSVGEVSIASAASTGLRLFNTADETTNTEYGQLYFSANTLFLRTLNGGSGTYRNLQLVAGSGSGMTFGASTGASTITASIANGSTPGLTVTNSASWTSTSVVQDALAITGTVNQTSGSGGFRGLVINPTLTAVGSTGALLLDAQSSGTSVLTINSTGKISIDGTVTGGGTTGNQTINKPSGTVNFAAAATALTVTNSTVTASSIVTAIARTNDATCSVKNVVPASGSFVINMTAACTAETSVGFVVIEPI